MVAGTVMAAAVAAGGGPPEGTVIGLVRDDEGAPPALHAAEHRLMTALPAARRDDFRLGRVAAARCLTRLGAPGPVLADGRLPRFPDGVTGSISHRDGTAVCLAAAGPRIRAVGVDIERVDALPLAAARLVCTEGERGWLECGPGDAVHRLGALFSLKESLYKALCALGVGVRGLKEVECPVGLLEGFPLTGRFTVRGVRFESGGVRSSRSVLTWAVART
ncbi:MULTISPECIES: 4'-phosphopantetheinyl transferase [unclassified Streptomyces]|uniref:4'-phosphopantetheinyl transferase family protein n=1 Tax=unclassified Streptomyces TaxID=2593676 RepID=UPI0037BBE199